MRPSGRSSSHWLRPPQFRSLPMRQPLAVTTTPYIRLSGVLRGHRQQEFPCRSARQPVSQPGDGRSCQAPPAGHASQQAAAAPDFHL